MKYYSSFEITAENCLLNRAINYGDGVFETMLLKNNEIPLWNLHWHRLSASLALLRLQPLDEKLIFNKALSLVNDTQSYVVKLVVFRNDTARGYSSDSQSSQFYITVNPYKKSQKPHNLVRSSVKLSKQKILAGLKHLNRLEQVIAAQKIINTDYTDAIMCDEEGHVIETISKNIILFKNNKIYSPLLTESGVYGVALRWLESQGHEINWKKIEFNDLAQYHGMMVCNSVMGFSSIKNIDGKIFYEKRMEIAKKIKSQWRLMC